MEGNNLRAVTKLTWYFAIELSIDSNKEQVRGATITSDKDIDNDEVTNNMTNMTGEINLNNSVDELLNKLMH